MESGSVKKSEKKHSSAEVSSSDVGRCQEKVSPKDEILPNPDNSSNKENINNNAHLSCDPEYEEDAGIAHYQDPAAARLNENAPVDVRAEAGQGDVHMERHNVEVSSHLPNNSNLVNTAVKGSRQSSEGGVGDCTSSKDIKSKEASMPGVKEESVCDEPPVYNDIAMDPSPGDSNSNIANQSQQHPADSSTTKSDLDVNKIISQGHQSSDEKSENDNTQILLVYMDENSSDSALQVDENGSEMTPDGKTANLKSKLGEAILVKNEKPTEGPFDKSGGIKNETVASPRVLKEENKQMEACSADAFSGDSSIGGNVVCDRNDNSCPPQTSGVKFDSCSTEVIKAVVPMESAATCSSDAFTHNKQQDVCGPSNKQSESDMFKDTSKHFKQPTFDGTGRQSGETNMMLSSDSSSNRSTKSETVISQFNLFPTEKDVMAAVYQNTAETSHLTNNTGLLNSQSNSTSVVSTHSSCSSYIPGDLQTNSGYADQQGSHSKWFASQVNLAAALCVANNSNYQEVQGSSPLIPQRSPQQRNVFSPSYQKDFSQFVLQSPKPNVHGNQNISPSMLCSPSSNLFDSLMYQSENPFSPTGSRSDTSRSYTNVQDLEELMSSQHLQQQQQQPYQQRQAQCFMNSSAHQANPHDNRSQDLNWNSMNQPTSLPGVASLLSSVSGSMNNSADVRPSSNLVLSNNSGTPQNAAYNIRDRYLNSSGLPHMANVAVENVRPQKDLNMMPCNSNVIIEDYASTQYQGILQRPETGQRLINRNWNAAPHEDRECHSRPNTHKPRPRKQNISESCSAPQLLSKQPAAKSTKRSHSHTETSSTMSTVPAAKKPNNSPVEEDSKGYVNYQIASTIHTLKPRHIVSWYIDFLIKENENITDMSHSYSIPAGIFDDRDFYFMESLLKRMSFPTKKFANWMQVNFPSININAIDFSEGRRRQQNYIVDEAKYWSERTQVDIINEVFYHFQSVRDQK